MILGDTGIGMSVRGEQFWLDKTRAAQLRPRSRPRYTLTPSIVFKDGEPFMAIGTPGRRQPGADHPAGPAERRRVLGRVVSEPARRRSSWPRVQTLHFYGSFWPHRIDLNRLDVEANVGAEVIAELKARGHDVRSVPPVSISGCATAVMIDPRSGARHAGADPRRDCYAFAF